MVIGYRLLGWSILTKYNIAHTRAYIINSK